MSDPATGADSGQDPKPPRGTTFIRPDDSYDLATDPNGPDVIFLGPSLPRERAQQIHPDAVFLPPAAMGDVLAALRRYRPRAIGLIDGTFLSNMSVFHKELLYAMDHGIWLLGSSSMGALRAAECHRYGMIGVGEVFDSLASGELEDDDEVALTHADAASGFRNLSDAMVTIRATIAGAVTAGALDPELGEAVVDLQKSRWFPERRLSDVPQDALDLGLPPEQLPGLKEYLRTHVIDPKRQDAIALLEQIQNLPDGPFPDPPGTVMSVVFRAVLARDVVVETESGTSVTFERMRRYALLNEDDYQDVQRATKQRMALANLALSMAGQPTNEERARGRAEICRRLGVADEDLEARAASLDMDARELRVMIGNEALLLRMEESHLGMSTHNLGTQTFMHELRLRGRYEQVKQRAALQEHAARNVMATGEIPPAQLLLSHASLTGWQIPDDIQAYVQTHGVGTVRELLLSVGTSVRAHQALFGVGLVEHDGDQEFDLVDSGEPMMTRGQ